MRFSRFRFVLAKFAVVPILVFVGLYGCHLSWFQVKVFSLCIGGFVGLVVCGYGCRYC